jgi:hypothetical protein
MPKKREQPRRDMIRGPQGVALPVAVLGESRIGQGGVVGNFNSPVTRVLAFDEGPRLFDRGGRDRPRRSNAGHRRLRRHGPELGCTLHGLDGAPPDAPASEPEER